MSENADIDFKIRTEAEEKQRKLNVAISTIKPLIKNGYYGSAIIKIHDGHMDNIEVSESIKT